MPALDTAPYQPSAGDPLDATEIAGGFAAIQAVVNALDSSNFAGGSIFDPTLLMQAGARTGQPMAWDGTAWGPEDTVTLVRTNAQYGLIHKLLAADAQPAFQIRGDGRHEWGPGGSSAIDVNLARSGAGTLTLTGILNIVGSIQVGGAAVGSTHLADSANLARLGSSNTFTQPQGINSSLTVTGTVVGAAGGGEAFRVGNDAGLFDVNIANAIGIRGVTDASTGMLVFGSGNDVNLYRYIADQLKTDDLMVSALNMVARQLAASQVMIGDTGGGQAGVMFGVAPDAKIYREGAAQLRSDSYLTTFAHYIEGPSGLMTRNESQGVLGLSNRPVPNTPVGGGFLFCEGGALKYRGTTGTTTQIAPP